MLPDLTSTWIPLSLLAVLCAYMAVLFQRERRMSHELDAAETTISVAAPAVHGGGHAPAETSHVQAMPAPAHHAAPAMHSHAEPAPVRKKPRLLWRTASIWLPFTAGFAGQAYLNIIRPLIEKMAG